MNKILKSRQAFYLRFFTYNFPGGSDGKASERCFGSIWGDLGSIPRSGRPPGEGNGNALQYSCLKNPKDKRGLAGYSPWGHKELNMTE